MTIKFTYYTFFYLLSFFLFAQANIPKRKVKDAFYIKINEQSTLSSKQHHLLNSAALSESGSSFQVVSLNVSKGQARKSEKSILDGLYKITANDPGKLEQLMDSLSQFDNVVYVEPLYQETLLYTPNDPDAPTSQPYLNVIKAYDGWELTKGKSDIKIGIIDTGVELDHEDLKDKIYRNTNDPVNGIDDDANGYIDDYKGYDFADMDPLAEADASPHGSRVAGLAGASTDNSLGIAGVGFNCMMVPLKIFKSETSLSAGAYEAILYAADNGIDVINLSWGSVESYSQAAQDIINYAVLEKDVVVIAAAGNDNNENRYYPASYHNVLSVAATNDQDEKAGFSTYNYLVDMVAPGQNIYSTQGGAYGRDNGTSYSAPLVAGTAALIRSQHPHLTARQVMELIRVTSDDIYETGSNMNYYGNLGKGRLNVHRALSETSTAKSIRVENVHYSNPIGERPFFGDTVCFTFDLINYLNPVNDVTMRFSSNSDYVEILTEEINIGSLDSLSSTSHKQKIIRLKENTPPETKVNIRIDFSAEEYRDFQYLQIESSPDYFNFGNERLKLTMAGNGNLGYAENGYRDGLGLEWMGAKMASRISFFAAHSPEQVSDNFPTYTNSGFREGDFISKRPAKFTSSEQAELTSTATFADDSASMPLGLSITQRAFTNHNDDYLILEYLLSNTGTDTIKHLASGLYLDWDIPTISENSSYYSPEEHLLVTYSSSQNTYGGIKTFFDKYPVRQALDLDNSNGNTADLDPELTEPVKYELTSTSRYDSAGMRAAGNDVAGLLAADSLIIPPLRSKKVTFMIAMADNYETLVSQIHRADSIYKSILERPLLLESITSCEGAPLTIDPISGRLFRFYADPLGNEFITEDSTLSLGMIDRDTTIYLTNVDQAESDLYRIDITLIDQVAAFELSTDTLYIDDPRVNTVSCTDQSFLPVSWKWTFSNGQSSQVQNPTVNFTTSGKYEITLLVENELGCTDQTSKDLVVVQRPEPPVIDDISACKGESISLTATNADKLKLYREQSDKNAVAVGASLALGAINQDTCLYVTKMDGPYESLKKRICISIEDVSGSFTYLPDTTSVETAAIFTNTSPGATVTRWYIDGELTGNEKILNIPATEQPFTLTLVNTSSGGCRDSVTHQIQFQASPTPEDATHLTCAGQEVILKPSGGTYFAFYADAKRDSLISKGQALSLNELHHSTHIYVANLDSIIPSDLANIHLLPDTTRLHILASPDTLILSELKSTQFSVKPSNLSQLRWYRNSIFEETIASPRIFFETAGIYEITLEALSEQGCPIQGSMLYHVLDEKAPKKTQLGIADPHIHISPNPSSGAFSISAGKVPILVMVQDVSGKQILKMQPTSDKFVIELGEEKRGTYIITFVYPQYSEFQKIILK